LAELLKGKRKGGQVKLHQWCNDWFMLEDATIVSPTSLKFTDGEIELIKKTDNGMMFAIYELTEDNTFKKRKRSI
jgi:hypothetical protein